MYFSSLFAGRSLHLAVRVILRHRPPQNMVTARGLWIQIANVYHPQKPISVRSLIRYQNMSTSRVITLFLKIYYYSEMQIWASRGYEQLRDSLPSPPTAECQSALKYFSCSLQFARCNRDGLEFLPCANLYPNSFCPSSPLLKTLKAPTWLSGASCTSPN
jgi:hypothetical protein